MLQVNLTAKEICRIIQVELRILRGKKVYRDKAMRKTTRLFRLKELMILTKKRLI